LGKCYISTGKHYVGRGEDVYRHEREDEDEYEHRQQPVAHAVLHEI